MRKNGAFSKVFRMLWTVTRLVGRNCLGMAGTTDATKRQIAEHGDHEEHAADHPTFTPVATRKWRVFSANKTAVEEALKKQESAGKMLENWDWNILKLEK